MENVEPKYPVKLSTPIAWGDMDAFGHVNNTVFFRLFESGRIAYFDEVQMPPRPIHQEAEDRPDHGPILASTNCDFLLPLTYPDNVRVETGVERVGNSSFTMVYRILSEKFGWKEAGRGKGVVVWCDYKTGKSVPLPEDIKQRMRTLES
ncbi:MAG: acyl-CoA thioesterase [Planctomycetes bacterium]|nr:acyl-CoA thioesterase [Planctomycetota bacterium]